MGTSSGVPLALKVFFFSLISGVGSGYGAFRLCVYLVLKYWKGDNVDTLSLLFGMAAALLVGVSSAVTAGVLAGRASKA